MSALVRYCISKKEAEKSKNVHIKKESKNTKKPKYFVNDSIVKASKVQSPIVWSRIGGGIMGGVGVGWKSGVAKTWSHKI